jgi:hypothetical protein
MQNQQPPPCRRCGNTQPQLFSSRPRYAITDPAHARGPVGTSYVYSCTCGLSFTHEDDLPLPGFAPPQQS